jgi:small conductance mechanosensitive channel
MQWLASEAGTKALAHSLTIVLIAGSALVIWEVLSHVIERSLEERAGENGGPRSARLLTLLPLLRNVVRVVLIVMVTLIILSEINIDIGPLLAGAGVVGLAVGFGSQALVKDIITGAFILIEDSLAVGDWVEVGSHSGTVEAMTIRTVTLRDLYGTVHIVPFGEVTSVLNYNRGFGHTLIDVGVAYRENVDEVIAVLEEIGRELSEDPTFGPSLLGPLEISGLNKLADSAVEIRVGVKTRPMHQARVAEKNQKDLRRTRYRDPLPASHDLFRPRQIGRGPAHPHRRATDARLDRFASI